MQLVLSENCPIFTHNNARYLHRLLDAVAKGWHNIVSPAPEVLRRLLNSTWDVYGELLHRGLKSGVHKQAYFRPASCEGCDPDRLSAFLAQPVTLLVENATTDGGFLQAAAEVLRPGLSSSFSGNRSSVAVEQAGGIGAIPKELARLVSARHQSVEGLPPRFVVVCDSDRKHANDTNVHVGAVRTAALQNRVDCHVLHKRTIENYLPQSALEAYSRTRRQCEYAVSIIVGLSDTAWDYYPMKPGLADPDRRSHEELALFEEIEPGVGMGDFMEDFLAHFRYHLNGRDVRVRDHSGDLDELLDVIERNI